MARHRLPNIFYIIQATDLSISTWLLLGASAQCLLLTFLPRNIAVLPAIIFFLYRIIRTFLVASGRLPNPLAEGVIYGRTTAQFPSSDGSITSNRSSSTIVVLVLGFSTTHAAGRFTPGSKTTGQYFTRMWRQAESKREEYGYLGNTPALTAEPDTIEQYGTRTGDDKGVTMVWISYWKSLDGLHQFAHEGAHLKGWRWWEKEGGEKLPHVGVMHEAYEVPAGNWENIFHNFKPFAIGNTKFALKRPSTELEEAQEKGETVKFVSGLSAVPAKAKEWKSMETRMGRPLGSVSAKK
ncbi:uncharacterized protein BDR25DRAFT_274927 [Lindgomyces ingoldianus]|uniref:Uncharacterized protein n=1 Tax=Lindgomyces ingoldianus TaxID=673940 RepID=A0ACB6RET5_9PLEO|nr:uncharacterized protein BDR25DRAFT_274927 [Lindgomyces ingoldianus]KAF2477632.1 hypothetical protein BDR25DRAFT_274927 [Lindgomyces ingoldianus]